MRLHPPWRVRKFLAAAWSCCHYLFNRTAHLVKTRRGGKWNVLICVPFYGYTGGALAIVSTGNLLSGACNVSFLTKPSNIMNRFVSPQVRMVRDIAGSYDFCVLESGTDASAVADLKRRGTRIILAMHGAPPAPDGTKNHGYTDEQITSMLGLSDSILYSSDVQLPIFEGFPSLHRRKIGNFIPKIEKRDRNGAAGIVCDTTLPHKRAAASIKAAELSKASTVEVWGPNHGQQGGERVHWHGFSGDKQHIYNSFDVLVHLSILENQPLVILDCLSAGIPCVLTPLPTYQFLHGLDGIFFVDPDDPVAGSEAINRALDCSAAVRHGLEKFWRDNHSPDVVRGQWMEYLAELSAS